MKAEERALQVWSVLVLAARNRQVLTYEMVAQACGLASRGLRDFLMAIHAYCEEEGLPPLTSLVVSKKTGLPGSGFPGKDVPQLQARTFAKDWLAIRAPKPEDFAVAYRRSSHQR